MSGLNDGIFIMDQQQFIHCNSRVQELFECNREEIIGSTPFKFSPEVQPDGRKSTEKGEQYIKKALAGTPQVFQWMHETKTGKLIDTEVSLNSIELQDGTYLQAIVRDITKQKEAENALKRSEELFRNLFLRAPVAMVMVDQHNEVKMVNRKFEELFGYLEDELKGRDVDKIIVPEGEYDAAPKMPAGELLSNDFIKEYRRITKEGEKIDVLVGAIPVYLEGEPLAGFGIYIDISDQKNTQRQLEDSLQEKEVLLKEIHHRVKNNLGVISALLKLQVFSEENEEISEILGDSLVRIKTMALVHETLYETGDFANLKFNKYINNLVELNIDLSGTRHRDVEINFDIEEIDLNINQAIPFALILNELVSNVFLFAFEGREDGAMSIQLYQKKNDVHLIVKDNGVGLPANFEEMRKESLGMTLIDQLTDQLGGDLKIASNGGTRFEIVFKRE
ncbi:MAG: PAS domain S-box protein [Balneolaceae bacterium]|nr:PAS domain S-box protein [Balneolaceae bacterium]